MADGIPIKLIVHCCNMPGRVFREWTDVRLGIQKGKEVVDEAEADRPATFIAEVRVARNASTGAPNFLGPYAHGTPADRFLYLSWSGVGAEGRKMFRRAKIPLREISWDRLRNALERSGELEITLDMTDRDGGPGCATLKQEGAAWTVRAQPSDAG